MATATHNIEQTTKKSLYTPDGKPMSEEEVRRRRAMVERAFLTTKPGEAIVMATMVGLMIYGFGFWVVKQLIDGLTITDLTQKVFWGVYITNFVFWIGVSHVGMLISAVLRILDAKFRTPITRIAEEVTIVSLVMGVASVLIDMGRLDRAQHIAIYGNITSPLVWDVISITFYLTGSLIFFYTPIIPDFAYYRDNLDPEKHKVRQRIYKILALNWKGTPEQFHKLEHGIMERLKWFILPIALSVHTVVSWIFAVTWRPGWNSTIFGPYFISGAIFSGTAALVTALVVFTWYYKLDDYITVTHIQSANKILLATNFAYMYFTLNEYLIPAYKRENEEMEVLYQVFYGDLAPTFWFIMVGTMLIPFIMGMKINTMKDEDKTKVYWYAFISSVLVNIGAWLKRYVILVPSLRIPVIDESEGIYPYNPTQGEIWITIAQVAFFIFFYWFINKIVPHIPLWEVELEWERDGLVDGETPTRKHLKQMGSTFHH